MSTWTAKLRLLLARVSSIWLVTTCIELVSTVTWIQLGSSLDPAGIQLRYSLDPAWIQPGPSLATAWIKLRPSLDPACAQRYGARVRSFAEVQCSWHFPRTGIANAIRTEVAQREFARSDYVCICSRIDQGTTNRASISTAPLPVAPWKKRLSHHSHVEHCQRCQCNLRKR